VPDDEVGAGVTAVGVAAVELASDDGAVGATATADVVESEVLVGVVVDEVGVEPIVEVEPVVPDAADAALAAASVAEVTISPFAGVSERNDEALGAWMFASARPGLPWPFDDRNPTACGGGITMPIVPASCSMRWSSPSVATL
jgi:hypothetical protein